MSRFSHTIGRCEAILLVIQAMFTALFRGNFERPISRVSRVVFFFRSLSFSFSYFVSFFSFFLVASFDGLRPLLVTSHCSLRSLANKLRSFDRSVPNLGRRWDHHVHSHFLDFRSVDLF